MLDLAYHGEKKPVTLTDIAKRQNISLSYLEQLFACAGPAWWKVCGPGGGYQLSRDTSQINVADIITAVDEATTPPVAGGKGNCQNFAPLPDPRPVDGSKRANPHVPRPSACTTCCNAKVCGKSRSAKTSRPHRAWIS